MTKYRVYSEEYGINETINARNFAEARKKILDRLDECIDIQREEVFQKMSS
jgi:hypothetical protein